MKCFCVGWIYWVYVYVYVYVNCTVGCLLLLLDCQNEDCTSDCLIWLFLDLKKWRHVFCCWLLKWWYARWKSVHAVACDGVVVVVVVWRLIRILIQEYYWWCCASVGIDWNEGHSKKKPHESSAWFDTDDELPLLLLARPFWSANAFGSFLRVFVGIATARSPWKTSSTHAREHRSTL